MNSDIVSSIVGSHTRQQVETDVRALDAEIRRCEREIEQLQKTRVEAERARALLQQVIAYMAGDEPPYVPIGGPSQGTDQAPRKPISKREPILKLMRQRRDEDPTADRWWSVPDVRAALAHEGIDATRNLVRVTLRRMVDSEQIVADEDGMRFGLPD